MLQRHLLFFLALLCTATLSAQSIVLFGKVIEKEKKQPIAGVLVTVRPDSVNRVLQFTQTKEDGTFQLSLKTLPARCVLHFSLMGFAPLSTPITEQTYYEVALSEKVTQLKEVIVKAKGIFEKGDTVTYIVSKYTDVQDKNLASVLKKMPGIEVSKAGTIKYNGVEINRFYIEGKDLLQGKYGLATNNLHPQDVGSVEVLERHQPIKALEDISFSQNPAINIRLKEDAKARWVGTIQVGTGASPFLWRGEAVAMRFKKGTQTLNTYKTNNTGDDVTREGIQLTFDGAQNDFGADYKLTRHLEVSPTYLHNLDRERSRENRTHSFSTNNLWSLGKNYELTSQISYLHDRKTSNYEAQTTYFLDNGEIRTELSENALSKEHQLKTNVTLNANTRQYYLKNQLSADLRWQDVEMALSGTYPNRQSARTPHQQITNHLEWIRRNGKKVFSLYSYNSFQSQSPNLTVQRTGGEVQQQQVDASAFYTRTHTTLGYYWKPFTVSVQIGVAGLFRQMNSQLTGVSDTLGGLQNEVSLQYAQLYAKPKMELKSGDFEAELSVPIAYQPHWWKNRLSAQKEVFHLFSCSPRLYVKYYLTSRLYFSTSAQYTSQALPEQSFYQGLILNNYRSLSQGFFSTERGSNKSVMLSANYKQPLQSFFADVSMSRMWSNTPYQQGRTFIGNYLLYRHLLLPHYARTWYISGHVSKGIDFMNGLISWRSTLYQSSSTQYQQGGVTAYTAKTWSNRIRLNSKPASWCNATYEFNHEYQQLRLSESAHHTSRHQLSQKLSVYLSPHQRCYLEFTGEHYVHQIAEGGTKQIYFADASLTYTFKGGWECNIQLRNLFNERAYTYTLYDGLTSYENTFRLNPRRILLGVFFRF